MSKYDCTDCIRSRMSMSWNYRNENADENWWCEELGIDLGRNFTPCSDFADEEVADDETDE